MAIEDVPEPVAGEREVIVQPEAAGICGSEVEGYLGLMPNRVPPLVMGHEFAGRVVVAGTESDPSWVGKRVAINPIVGCGECRYCTSGQRQLCPDRYLIGIGVPGGFASSVAVPTRCLFEMPNRMDARLGALAEPLANGIHALRQVPVADMSSALIIGAGTIGIACMHAALLAGIERVIVAEPNEARRNQARQLGAHDVLAQTDQATERHDLAIDAVGTAATRDAAVDLLVPAGTAIFIGMHSDETPMQWRRIVRGNVTIRGTFGYADADFDQALRWLADGRAAIGQLRELTPLEQGPEVFADLARGASTDIKVFLGEPAASA